MFKQFASISTKNVGDKWAITGLKLLAKWLKRDMTHIFSDD
ncbi:MAG: hypothetical protein RLZZ479_147 [Bacteroidota bacterium]|jgi:hypothetical protein